ncbi:hypothetical protein V9L05_19825 [Bernardetia sp. Wsw4-3y2]|uniref:hypothetical protein n=1 Tax=Bernardetia sp. Wsw4-3y2 TaxID=3127471 RepID=UPI0030CDB9CD
MAGISDSLLSFYEIGKQKPSEEFLEFMSNEFNEDLELLKSLESLEINSSEIGKISNVISNKLGNIEGTEALHSCQSEVSRLEGLLAEKEELIKELRARITDKEDMVSMLKNQLKVHESTQNKQNKANDIRQTG